MQDFVKETVLPLLIVLCVLTSCALSMCYYHCLRYMRERRYLSAQRRDDDNENDSIGEETQMMLKKIGAGQHSSKTGSLASFPDGAIEYTAIDDIMGYLHLRDVTMNAVYNYAHGFLQIAVSTIRLYPLPMAIRNNFMLQYKICLDIPGSMAIESAAKPLRYQVHFDEKYRLHHSLHEVEDSELRLDIYVIGASLRPHYLWTVNYLLKPDEILSSEADRALITGDIRIRCLNQVHSKEELAKLLLSLCYKPTSGRIHLKIVRGVDFPVTAHDVRLRVTILQTRHGSVRSFHTPIVESHRCPQIDDAFSLKIAVENIETTIITVTLLYGIDMASFAPIAEVKIGSLAPSESGKQHWNDMLMRVREDVEMWHEFNFDHQ